MYIDTRFRPARAPMKLVSLSALAMLSACSGGSSGGGNVTGQPIPSPTPTTTPAPTPTPTSTPTPTPGFTQIQAAVDASPVPNIYVAIGTSAGVIYRYQKGSFSPTGVTSIASASKMLSGATILRLVEAGRMSLSDHPQKYLSYWTNDPADQRSQVTLQQLLSFTSGFDEDEGDRGCITDGTTTIAACAQEFYNRGLGSAPGTAFNYGPAHLQIAGAMAEAATGLTFRQLFRQQVADVAGMSNATDYVFSSTTNPRLSGGGVSTVEDYIRFLDAILNRRLLTDINSYTADRTAGLTVLNTPDVTISNGQWHYALASWHECDDTPFSARCTPLKLVSSPGAFGWTPWIDYDRGYWALIGMEVPNGSQYGVGLEQQLQPIINDYLGKP